MPPSGGWKRTPCSSIQRSNSLERAMVSLRQRLVGLAAGDAIKIVEEFALLVGPGHGRRGAVMGEPQIAGVAGIAAAIKFRRGLDHDDACSRRAPR